MLWSRLGMPFKKNIAAVAIGVLLSFVLAFVGSGLAWLVLIGRTRESENKGAIITFMIAQTLIVYPLVAVLVGVFVSLMVQKRVWWLAGLTLLPLLIYGLGKGSLYPAEILVSTGYLLVGVAAAFFASRLKRNNEALPSHV